MFIGNLGIMLLSLSHTTLLFYYSLYTRASFLFSVRWTYLIITILLWASPVQAICGDGRGCSLKSLPKSTAAIILSVALLLGVVLLIVLIRSLRIFRRDSTRDHHTTTAQSPFVDENPSQQSTLAHNKTDNTLHLPSYSSASSSSSSPSSSSSSSPSKWRWWFHLFVWFDNDGSRRQSKVACEKVELDQVLVQPTTIATIAAAATPTTSSMQFHPIIASQAIEQVASPLSLTATPFSTRRWRRMFCETTERPPSPPPPPPPSPVRVRSINNWKHNDRWSSSQQRSRRLEWPVALPASYTSRLLESTLLPRPSPSIVHPRWIPVSAHWPSFAFVAERPAVTPAESNSNTTATSTTIAQPVELVAPPSRSLVRAATWSPQCTSAIQSSEMSQKAIDRRDTTPSSTAATTLHSVSVESSMATSKQTANHDQDNFAYMDTSLLYSLGDHQLDKMQLAQLLKPHSRSRRSFLIANLLAQSCIGIAPATTTTTTNTTTTAWPMTSTINDITPTDVTIISATTDINSKAIDQEQQQQQRVPSIV